MESTNPGIANTDMLKELLSSSGNKGQSRCIICLEDWNIEHCATADDQAHIHSAKSP